MHVEIIEKINHLPIPERVEIIEEISRGLSRELRENGDPTNSSIVSNKQRKEAIARLRGLGKIEGKPAPTDTEAKEEYNDFLEKKYK